MSLLFAILFVISIVITIFFALALIWSYVQHEPNFATEKRTIILMVITMILMMLGIATS